MTELACSVCIYVRPRPGLDEDARAELEVLTVVDGQMVCLRHIGCASRTHHDTIVGGVRVESQGAMESLSEYQKWRREQDRGEGSSDPVSV